MTVVNSVIETIRRLPPSEHALGVVSVATIVWSELPQLEIVSTTIGFNVLMGPPFPNTYQTILLLLNFLTMVLSIYVGLPKFYPSKIKYVTRNFRARIFLTLYVSIFAFSVYLSIGVSNPHNIFNILSSIFSEYWVFVLYVGGGLLVMGASLNSMQQQPLTHQNNKAMKRGFKSLNVIDIQSWKEESRERIALEHSHPYAYSIYIGLLLFFVVPFYFLPVFVFSMFVGILNSYYPALEAVALVFFIFRYSTGIIQYFNAKLDSHDIIATLPIPSVEGDIEIGDEFLSLVKETYDLNGWGAVILFVPSIGLSVVIFALPHRNLPVGQIDAVGQALMQATRTSTVASIGYLYQTTVKMTTLFGLAIILPVVSFASIWYWYCKAKRIPAVLYQHRAPSENSSSKDLTTAGYPPDLLLVPVAMLILWAFHYETYITTFGISITFSNLTFTIAWMGLFVVLIQMVRWPLKNSAQPIRSPIFELILPFVIFTTSISLVFGLKIFTAILFITSGSLFNFYGKDILKSVQQKSIILAIGLWGSFSLLLYLILSTLWTDIHALLLSFVIFLLVTLGFYIDDISPEI